MAKITFYIICILSLALGFQACSGSRLPMQTNFIPPGPESKYTYGQVEPVIAIHPKNPNWMAAASVLTDYYHTLDGGNSWISSTLKSTHGVYGDPVLIFDTSGSIFYYHLASVDRVNHLDRIVCQKGNDLTGQFNDGSFTKPVKGKTQDKHWIVYDPKFDVHYMTWTQFDKYDSKNPFDSSVIHFALSNDQGQSWSEPKRISSYAGDCLDDDFTVEGAVPIVTNSGKIIVTWSGPKGLVLQESIDRGATWLKNEIPISEHLGGWNFELPGFGRANGLPFLKCNPLTNELYLVWCAQNPISKKTSIYLKKSADEGKNWSESQCIFSENGTNQFFVNLAVSPETGLLNFIYYNQRKQGEPKTEVYYGWSTDGVTFKSSLILNSHFVPNASLFFGDYLGIDARLGKIALIYPKMVHNKVSLWSTIIQEASLKDFK